MHILAYSDIFKYKQKYSQAHSEHSVTLAYLEPWHIQYQKSCYIQNPGIFRALAYLECLYIQNSGMFRVLEYSELFYIQNTGVFSIVTYS